jgi:carboxylesterase type B
MLLGDTPPTSLVDAMQETWLAFARTGDPANDVVGEFPAYDLDRRATLRFDAEVEVVDDPEAPRRQLWEPII